jgi:hypothetical protein
VPLLKPERTLLLQHGGPCHSDHPEALNGVLDHLPNVRANPTAELPCFASLFMRLLRSRTSVLTVEDHS